MIIVTASDQRFAPLVATMLHSAWTHNPEASFYVFDCGLEPDTRMVLQAFGDRLGMRLTIVGIDLELLSDLQTTDIWPVAVYSRLLIPDILPMDCDKALYLDADCIVASDLSELWAIDLGDHLLAGVDDTVGRSQEGIMTGLKLVDYVNAGVILINVRAWRDEKIASAVFAFARANQPFYQDQSSLNAVASGRILAIDASWNFMLHLELSSKCRAIPRILHYSGPVKTPEFISDPFAPIWLHHRNATPYPAQTPRKRPVWKGLVGLLRLRRDHWRRFVLDRRYNRKFARAYLSGVARRR